LESAEYGMSETSILRTPSCVHGEIQIVGGKMPINTICIAKAQSLPIDDLKHSTLVCDQFPNSLMGRIEHLGGIVCGNGTGLSHFAITAKYYETPLIIKK
jgi:phosphohistidine swiveling domain-containing protein